MFSLSFGKRGIVLFITLGTLLVVVAFANVIMSIITSQGRLTQHQAGRIQAYYASQAGMNYGLERLRAGSWTSGVDCLPANGGCDLPNDTQFPRSIVQPVKIFIRPFASLNCSAPAGSSCVNATATYTYTP